MTAPRATPTRARVAAALASVQPADTFTVSRAAGLGEMPTAIALQGLWRDGSVEHDWRGWRLSGGAQ